MLGLNPSRWLKSLKQYQPLRKLRDYTYELLAENDTSNPAASRRVPTTVHSTHAGVLRKIYIKLLYCMLLLGLALGLLLYLQPHRRISSKEKFDHQHRWKKFKLLDGYFQGISRLVAFQEFVPENAYEGTLTSNISATVSPPLPLLSPTRYTEIKLLPYQLDLRSSVSIESKDLPPLAQCFLDTANKIPAPLIYAFEGVVQHSVEPLFGSYGVLGLRRDVCFDRYGRYGPYGLGYPSERGGCGLGMQGDQSLSEEVWKTSGQIDWRSVDLGDAQRRCFQRNQGRFAPIAQGVGYDHIGTLAGLRVEDFQQSQGSSRNLTMRRRTAVVLRAWGNIRYTPGLRLYIRSLVNELSLHSGGEFSVHLLIEVKDIHKPIWSSQRAYDEILADIVPEEFRSMATLWSEALMQLIYPGPFQPQFSRHGFMYSAMRSMHFALQWFMVQHPEYEYFWNWEMDLRYIGHQYELFDRTSTWAKSQPRDLLWERDARYYIPSLHGDWDAFMRDTRQKSASRPSLSAHPLQLNEEADLITFDPIFDPEHTRWNRRLDVTGYNTSLPIPARRASIVVAARFSRRLLLIMHNETYVQRHGMASEMFPASMCLHHGLKAVFAPHPVYLQRDWPAEFADTIFNGGDQGQSGGYENSVFGEGPKGHEHALLESTYYYNARFASSLWRRWMGYKEQDQGGPEEEAKNGGRMCLRSVLLHPVKEDVGFLD